MVIVLQTVLAAILCLRRQVKMYLGKSKLMIHMYKRLHRNQKLQNIILKVFTVYHTDLLSCSLCV